MKHKEWTMLLGRFQCIPPHAGHQALVESLLDEGKNVLIGLRKEDGTDKNPYTLSQRTIAFWLMYEKEIEEGRVSIVPLPDIVEIAYGRTPGWKIKEIKLENNLEKISGTEMRKKNEESK